MNNDNGFDLLIVVVFAISPQLGGIEPKDQNLVISSQPGEIETLQQFHLRSLHIRIKNFLLQDEIGQINNLAGKNIMEISKLKNIQR